MPIWDYKITGRVTTVQAGVWQAVRQIDWGEIEDLDPVFARTHWHMIKPQIDPAKCKLLEQYLNINNAG